MKFKPGDFVYHNSEDGLDILKIESIKNNICLCIQVNSYKHYTPGNKWELHINTEFYKVLTEEQKAELI